MNVRERLQALLDGKKIRSQTWDKAHYIDINSNPFISVHYLLAKDTEWELYENPIQQMPTCPKILNEALGSGKTTPKIKLKPEDVGKRVKLRDNSVYMITAYRVDHPYPIVGGSETWTDLGQAIAAQEGSEDIIEILD